MTPLRPMHSRDLLAAGARAVPGPDTRMSLWWAVAVTIVAVAFVPLLRQGPTRVAVVTIPWILAAGIAAAGWGYAARRATARPRIAFWTFGAAAALGVLAHLSWAYQVRAGFPMGAWAAVPTLLPYFALAAGAGLALGAHEGRVWIYRLAADAALLLLVAATVVLRWFIEPLLAVGVAEPAILAIAAGQSVAIIAALLAALVVLRRGAVLSPWAGTLLLVATVTFALGDLVALARLDPARPLAAVAPGGALELGGWVLLAAAGFNARRLPSTGPAMLALRRIPDAMRRLVVPAVTLFLAVALVDMTVGRRPQPETVAALAVLALLLAIRSARAIKIADGEIERVRQIAYTRTLVDVTHALAGTTSLDETLRIISESARDMFGTRGAGIELISEDGTSLETRSVVGLPENVVGLRFPIEGSFTGWAVRNGEPRATVDPSRDPFIQPQSLHFLGRWPVAAAPIQFRGEMLGALFACIRSEPFEAEELELMGAMAEQAAIAIQQARLFEQVTTLSITDPLTGLANRRQLTYELGREFAAAKRGRPLSVVIFDLDRFKQYNDTYGHLAGDKALATFGSSLQSETRSMNVAARYGGDEFVAVLSGTDAEGARIFVQRVRMRFGVAVESLGNGPLAVSAGVAAFAPGMEDPEALLRAADDELYATKPRPAAPA